MDIEVKGNIVDDDSMWIYDWLGISATSPKKINKALADANGQPVTVKINSPGGSVFSASEIYTSLRNYNGDVNVQILGLAASAASVIAMAGKSLMSPTAQIMIHPVSTSVAGNHQDMEHTAEILRNADETVANAYVLKTGRSKDEILAMMDKETWLSAQKAKELGFIDEIMFDNGNLSNKFTNIGKFDMTAMYNSLVTVPEDIINKLIELNKSNNQPIKENKVDFFIKQKAQAKLNLIKLGGNIDE